MAVHLPPEESPRFNGKLRSHHRLGVPQRSWDEWIEGSSAGPKKTSRKVILSLMIVLALAVALAGLIVRG